jgi:hypothetical protein
MSCGVGCGRVRERLDALFFSHPYYHKAASYQTTGVSHTSPSPLLLLSLFCTAESYAASTTQTEQSFDAVLNHILSPSIHLEQVKNIARGTRENFCHTVLVDPTYCTIPPQRQTTCLFSKKCPEHNQTKNHGVIRKDICKWCVIPKRKETLVFFFVQSGMLCNQRYIL